MEMLVPKIKLVSMTQPVSDDLIERTPEELIVWCARVSNPSNQDNHDTSAGLLRYLIKHGHWSPFEMVNVCYEIETSLAIATQIVRHRSFSFQQFSMRYAPAGETEVIEMRAQAKNNRQSSREVIHNDELNDMVQAAIQTATRAYDEMLASGVAREVARLVLPTASTTRLYMNGSLRSWIHYLQLRTQGNTQKEHRIIAKAIWRDLETYFPTVFEAL